MEAFPLVVRQAVFEVVRTRLCEVEGWPNSVATELLNRWMVGNPGSLMEIEKTFRRLTEDVVASSPWKDGKPPVIPYGGTADDLFQVPRSSAGEG